MAVYARQYGRTGNNLFQKAAAIGYATKHGIEYNLSPHLPSGTRSHLGAIWIKESGHQYQVLPTYKAKNGIPTILDGYWQSDRYFSHCREEVLKAFGYKWEHIPHTCSIHLRRGDYLLYPDKHPVITDNYLDQAIKYMCQVVGVNTFYVFSDDIPYTKELIESRVYYGCSFEYSTGRSETEDLEFMSSCSHNIISNSTFSWWAAWLNQNPNKVVVSPSKDNWFGPGNAHLDTSDLIPDSWIQIKY
jgi:hypothetical protein